MSGRSLIGQGKNAAQKALAENPALAQKIADAISAKRNNVAADSTSV